VRSPGDLEHVANFARGARFAIAALGERGDHAAPEGERGTVLLILDDFPRTAEAVEEQQRCAASDPAAPRRRCDEELRKPETRAARRPRDQRESDPHAVTQDDERMTRVVGKPACEKLAFARIPFAERWG